MRSFLFSALSISSLANEFAFDYSTCHKLKSCDDCMMTVNDKPWNDFLDGSKCIPVSESNSCESWWDVQYYSYTVDYACN